MRKEKFVVSATGDLELTMERERGRNERLGIRSEFPNDELATGLFRFLGLMHLIAPYFPDRVTTDFAVPKRFRQLIGEMYASEGRDAPRFDLTNPRLARVSDYLPVMGETSDDRAAVAYSGGKDSMWNLDWMIDEYGLDNVLAIHIAGMNRTNFSDEHKMTVRQSEAWGFWLEVIDLLNSSRSFGKSVMRSRDMFIVGMAIPLAMEFGAASVVLEGGFYPEDVPNVPYTTKESSWNYFNDLLLSMGVPVQVNWRDTTDMQAITDLSSHHPDWLPLVVNCFAPKPHRRKRREKWQRVAPSFPLFPTQCGSCVKCREFNIGRIDNDPSLTRTTEADIQALVEDTLRWAKDHEVDQADIIGGAFTEKLLELAKRYGVRVR